MVISNSLKEELYIVIIKFSKPVCDVIPFESLWDAEDREGNEWERN